jgi:ABC-type molybdenum transport system ATPase subunit/photorepair protein PhrA
VTTANARGGAAAAHPVLRILDEPTASLDPDAEYALFRHQSRLAAVSPGTITIFVRTGSPRYEWPT